MKVDVCELLEQMYFTQSTCEEMQACTVTTLPRWLNTKFGGQSKPECLIQAQGGLKPSPLLNFLKIQVLPYLQSSLLRFGLGNQVFIVVPDWFYLPNCFCELPPHLS
jgi:hypothetical protein